MGVTDVSHLSSETLGIFDLRGQTVSAGHAIHPANQLKAPRQKTPDWKSMPSSALARLNLTSISRITFEKDIENFRTRKIIPLLQNEQKFVTL